MDFESVPSSLRFYFHDLLCPKAAPPSVVFNDSKYVKLGVNRDKQEKLRTTYKVKSKYTQLTSMSHGPEVYVPVDHSHCRYLSCHDRRSNASHTSTITFHWTHWPTIWAEATGALFSQCLINVAFQCKTCNYKKQYNMTLKLYQD